MEPSDVDRNAVVVVHHDIEVNAPVQRVWQIHADVPGWRRWQDEISDVDADGPLQVGHSFTWTSYGFTVTSTVYAVEEARRSLWGGTSGGTTGIHEWTFRPTDSGTTVSTTESFSGLPVERDAAQMSSALSGSLTTWLQHLKRAAEEQPGSIS